MNGLGLAPPGAGLTYNRGIEVTIAEGGKIMKLPDQLAPLCALPHWVVWKYKTVKGKLTKIPYQVDGQNASSTEPKTWTTFEKAIAAKGFDGIGFVLTNSNIAAFDLDDCRDPETGGLEPWAADLIERCGSYVEITPSNSGVRIIGYGERPKVHRKMPVPNANGMACEAYRKAERYITISGNVYNDAPLENIDPQIDAVINELDGKKKKNEQPPPPNDKVELPPNILNMLYVPGAGSYPSRSELLFAFLTAALRARVSPAVILAGCLDSRYASGGIYQHVEENGGADYITRQIKKAADAAQVNTLPKIVVVQGKIARAVDETEQALIKAKQPVLVRAGSLVQPLWSRYRTAKGGETQATTLKALSAQNLAYMINRHAAIYTRYKSDGKELVIDPPIEALNMLLKLGHWSFPRCTGVISTPTLRPDGGLLTAAGYDVATGLWHWPDKKLQLPPIAERPTKDDAQKALDLLKSLLIEVSFVNDLDTAVALAGLLTPIVRGAFDLTPMFLFLAHEAGSGKSFLVDLISIAATGRYCPVITMVSNKEEMEKRLGSVLLEGPPIISIDNCVDNLEGQLLCQMVERPIVKVRVLGKSETPECEWRGTLYATGNNITYAGDMTRRGLICNLDPEVENPEGRTFKHDPIGELMANRGKYVAAALTIARAYFASGERVSCPPLGSYEGWSRFVREPLIWLGEEDPVKSMEQARRDDPNRDILHRLVDQWIAHLGTERSYKVAEITQVAEEKRTLDGMRFDLVRPEFHGVLVERSANSRGNEVEARRLGSWLKSIKGRIIDRHRIVISEESERHGNRWKLEPLDKKDTQGVSGVSGVAPTEQKEGGSLGLGYRDPTPETPLTPSSIADDWLRNLLGPGSRPVPEIETMGAEVLGLTKEELNHAKERLRIVLNYEHRPPNGWFWTWALPKR
jgi:hypothetical protein